MKKKIPLLRGSERDSFKTCQQQWYWAWRMGYRAPHDSPNALWFGAGIHLALAHYYQPQGKGSLRGFKRGPHPAETWARYVKDERPRFFRKDAPGDVDEKKYGDLAQLGTAMLNAYVDYYEGDPAWEFLAPELPFSILIPTHRGEPVLNYIGTWDGAYRDHERNGEVNLLETKTAVSISTRHLILAPQSLGYDLSATPALRDMGVIGPEEDVRFVVYNFLRKSEPDERPQNEAGHYLNKDGTVSKRQPPPYFLRHPVERGPAERRSTARHLVNEAAQMQAIREGQFAPTKNPGFLGENCRRCPFEEMCELHEQEGDWQEFAESFLVQRDPYADHRQGAVSSKFMLEV